MSKYNIDNGKTAIVDEIKHHEKHKHKTLFIKVIMFLTNLCHSEHSQCPPVAQMQA